MNQEQQELIFRYLNDECSDEECRTLTAWMKESPEHADEFIRCSAVHTNLRSFVAGSNAVAAPEPKAVRNVVEFPWRTVGLAIAASVVLLLALWPDQPATSSVQRVEPRPNSIPQPTRVSDPRPAAEWLQTAGVVWKGSAAHAGDKILPGVIAIAEGMGHLRFDHGVEVSLHGPVEFEILSLERTQLNSGRMTARVPDGAEGFTVLTKQVEVVDLGTHFGVEVNDASVNVAVFHGRVSVKALRSDETKIIEAGNAIHSANGQRLAATEISGLSFASAWKSTVGIERHSKSVVVRPVRKFGTAPLLSNAEIFVTPEGDSIPSPRDIKVDLSQPGEVRREADLSPGTIPAATIVRPYLIQFRPKSVEHNGESRVQWPNVSGEIAFAGKVLGVILTHEGLDQSERVLNHRLQRKLYGKNLGLDFLGPKIGDSLTLSEDRRVLQLSLRAMPGYSDYLRVLVAPDLD